MFDFKASNNEVEYKALMEGVRIATELNIFNTIVRDDSQLIVNQINENYKAKEKWMNEHL